ncbi:MAG: hypothetical protein MI863_12710 [Desulfobacterales bacterium]|nr:hypothetical protein [Desulfobacterales bacterium]
MSEKENNTANAPAENGNEERALSVFASERNEDMTALIFCLITTFLVLLFTKWMV